MHDHKQYIKFKKNTILKKLKPKQASFHIRNGFVVYDSHYIKPASLSPFLEPILENEEKVF